MSNLGLLLKKFSIPVLFLITALGMLYFGISTDQNSVFNLSDANVIIFLGLIKSF